MMKAQISITIVFVVVLSLGMTACQSQPETTQEPAQTSPSAVDIKTVIQQYIEQDAALKGAFLLQDPRTDQVLSLSFDHVHETVHELDNGISSVCVDFTDMAGTIYDVDVFVKANQATPEKLVLHKVNGEEVTP